MLIPQTSPKVVSLHITPETAVDHKSLEQDVSEFLKASGFQTTESTYHSVMRPELIKMLQRNYTPTALYSRHRADRLAISPDLVFEWECKTHVRQDRHDVTLEALPLAVHLAHAALGVKCLYIHRDASRNKDCGFWVDTLLSIPIRCIMIPGRWADEGKRYFRSVFERFMPGIQIVDMEGVAGSGDPFLIINQQHADALPHWKDLIREAMAPNGR